MNTRNLLAQVSLATLAATLVMARSDAATAATAPAETGVNQVSEVGEVVVTAQRREESLQKVPVAVTALTAASLEKSGAVSALNLPMLAPGLTMTVAGQGSQPYIRGVGGQSANPGFEGSVATYVDGVYIQSLNSSVFSFNNVERVEVLRGPQGTLFGRNTTGGLIQVITRKPTPEPTAEIGATAEDYSTVSGTFYGSSRVAENVSANLAVYANHQGTGYGKNLFLGTEIGYNREYSLRTQVLIEPTEDLSVLLSADYDYRDDDLGLNRTLFNGSKTTGGVGRTGGPQDSTSGVNRRALQWQWGVTQTVSLNLDWANLRSITGLRDWRAKSKYDSDTIPAFLTDVQLDFDTRTFQQEFVLQGDAGRLNWTAGAFYFYSSAGIHPIQTFGPVGTTTNVARYVRIDLNSYAAYAQATYAVTEKLNLTGGIRYTTDQRVLNGTQITTPGNPVAAGTVNRSAVDRRQDVSKPSWKVGADYQVTDGLMLYASASRSFKSGGFAISSFTDPPVRPEILTAVEGGFKSDLLDRRLRLNAALFHYDYKDIQITQVLGATSFLVNAAAAEMYGGEFEATLVPPVPVGRLELRANLAVLHAKYTAFPGAPINLANPVTAVPAGVVCPATRPTTVGGNLVCNGNASGNDMIRSPKWTVAGAIDYAFPVGAGELDISADYFHSDGFFWEPSNRTRQAAYDIVNAQVSYAPEGARWRVRVFGRNLTDQVYYSGVSEAGGGDVATVQPPRTFGVGVDIKLGAR